MVDSLFSRRESTISMHWCPEAWIGGDFSAPLSLILGLFDLFLLSLSLSVFEISDVMLEQLALMFFDDGMQAQGP